jgi:glycerol-3-phosphate dehydrogenase (NAD(P)+)
MTEKDFWRKANVVVIGGGNWGTVLAHLASQNAGDVRIWVRDEEQARSINSTRTNPGYVEGLQLGERVHAYSDLERVFDFRGNFGGGSRGGGQGDGRVDVVVWALPSAACREQARRLAPFFRGDELILHATKGIEEGSMKRISEILREEIPCPRIGVVSGPNLANEVARGEPAATVVASRFDEVIEAGLAIFSTPQFRVYSASDVVGVEWAGTLKNILAIAAGALDALNLGWNARAMMMTRGLAEMVRFGVAHGAELTTFLGLAGMGDLLATCSSPLSRNYRVGAALAQGEPLAQVLEKLGSTAEGVRTTRTVHEYARERGISMPITEGVYHLLQGTTPVRELMGQLMTRPLTAEL